MEEQKQNSCPRLIMEKQNFLLALYLAIVGLAFANAEPRAMFVLGDSTADVGTNNFLTASIFRADIPPYGIDFPTHKPTGRFSNGFNSADFIAMLLGLKRSPPSYFSIANNTNAFNPKRLRGVNFASARSGLLDITGQHISNPTNNQKNAVSLGEQIDQLYFCYSKLVAHMGRADARALLSKSLFFISTGSNDIFNYQQSQSTLTHQQFIAYLGSAYENHLRNLYKLGARKFGIISVPPIGCCPSQRALDACGKCSQDLNDLAQIFHSRIDALMCKLSSEYTDIKYSIGNTFNMTMNVIQQPLKFGFKDVQDACCGGGSFNGQSFCSPKATLCQDRKARLFWDLFHPTEAASQLAAITLFNGGPEFVRPINFKQLAQA